MTVDNYGSSAPVPYDPATMSGLGFEDIGQADMTMPRLTIDHKNAKFKNNLSGEEFETLRCVLLGVIKQRIMWPKEVEDGDKPMCKSTDFLHGFPNLDPEVKAVKQFPFDRSNFEVAHARAAEEEPTPDFPDGWTSNGLLTLPCSACIFKEWDKGDWKQPPCSEQHTYPLLYETEDGGMMPALISFQRTGIKPSRTYLNAFAQAGTPMFFYFTELTLRSYSRGTVDYCVPTFKKKEETDRNSWGEFAQQYKGVRTFVRSAPRPTTDEEDLTPPSDNTNTAPETVSSVTVPTVTPPSVPATPAPTVTAPVVSATPAPAPTVPTTPVTAPAPAVATVPTVSAPPSPSSDDDDDIPF